MIYAELSGGLGNQMFVYAFARAMGLCCQEPVTLIDRQDWKTGSPAHTALALQALHISSEVQFITDAGFAKQHLPVQNAAKALMIRHEQRVGLMDRDWHPFEARMAPMLNAIGLHFATEGFTPAKRGHAKNFLAWGYFQGADYFKDQAETIRAELLPIENPEHGFTAAAAAMGKYDLALLPAALSGGLVAYLFYNWHPAKVFMGDTGSLFLGGVVCAMAFALEMPLILILIGFVYVCEAMSDILQVSYFKATHGKRLFKMAPIHHHFEMCGWKEEKIVLVFAGVTVRAGLVRHRRSRRLIIHS